MAEVFPDTKKLIHTLPVAWNFQLNYQLWVRWHGGPADVERFDAQHAFPTPREPIGILHGNGNAKGFVFDVQQRPDEYEEHVRLANVCSESSKDVEGVAIALRWWLVNERDQWNGGGPTHVSFRPRSLDILSLTPSPEQGSAACCIAASIAALYEPRLHATA